MILTRRRSLFGAAALAAQPFCMLRSLAAAAPQTSIGLEIRAVARRLTNEGPATDISSFSGSDAPPILRVRKGEPFTLKVANGLAEPLSLLLHGVRGGNGLDDPRTRALDDVRPGKSGEVSLLLPDSGTYWFHARAGTPDLTSDGVRGVLIVEEPTPWPVDQDIVCLLADWTLDASNKRVLPEVPGSVPHVTLNDKPTPVDYRFRPGSRLRIRLINGSTRRVMLLAIEGARPEIVAIDGQPSERFQPVRDSVPIGPGATFDLAIDLPPEAGKDVRLLLRGTERSGQAVEPDRTLAVLKTEGVPLELRPPLAALAANPALPRAIPLEAATRAELAITREGDIWRINGVDGHALPREPVLRVRRGGAVTLGFENKSSVLVPLRVDGQAMRLLHSKDDGWEPYWRNSVLLPPGSRNHVAFVADLPGRYLIESGFNAQSVAGLRCWFEVLPS